MPIPSSLPLRVKCLLQTCSISHSHLYQYGDRYRKWGCRCSRGSTVRLCFPWEPSTSVTPFCENTEDGFQVFWWSEEPLCSSQLFQWPWQKSKKGVIKNKCYEEPNIRWGEQSMLGRFGQRLQWSGLRGLWVLHIQWPSEVTGGSREVSVSTTTAQRPSGSFQQHSETPEKQKCWTRKARGTRNVFKLPCPNSAWCPVERQWP